MRLYTFVKMALVYDFDDFASADGVRWWYIDEAIFPERRRMHAIPRLHSTLR